MNRTPPPYKPTFGPAETETAKPDAVGRWMLAYADMVKERDALATQLAATKKCCLAYGLRLAREALEKAADTELSGAIGCDPAYGRALQRAASIIDLELDRLHWGGGQS